MKVTTVFCSCESVMNPIGVPDLVAQTFGGRGVFNQYYECPDCGKGCYIHYGEEDMSKYEETIMRCPVCKDEMIKSDELEDSVTGNRIVYYACTGCSNCARIVYGNENLTEETTALLEDTIEVDITEQAQQANNAYKQGFKEGFEFGYKDAQQTIAYAKMNCEGIDDATNL